jgi:hypothetical protein
MDKAEPAVRAVQRRDEGVSVGVVVGLAQASEEERYRVQCEWWFPDTQYLG